MGTQLTALMRQFDTPFAASAHLGHPDAAVVTRDSDDLACARILSVPATPAPYRRCAWLGCRYDRYVLDAGWQLPATFTPLSGFLREEVLLTSLAGGRAREVLADARQHQPRTRGLCWSRPVVLGVEGVG